MADNMTDPSDAPVIEVAVGVAFDPLPELGPVGLARLASDWEDEYPTMREVPGHPPTRLEPGVMFQIGTGNLPSRLWLLSADENDLIQLQNDTLIINWRRMRPDDQYPGHASLLSRFERLWRQLVNRTGRHGTLRPIMVEWTYVDRLESGVLARGGLSFVDTSWEEQLPGSGRAFDFQIVRELSDQEQQAGYLTIIGNHAFSPNAEPFYALNITTKLDTTGLAPEGIAERLRQAHDFSLSAFQSVVDPKLQGKTVEK